MEEQNKNDVKEEVKVDQTITSDSGGSVQATSKAAAFLKDFGTPIAILIAGVFIGAGLYFSGTGGAQNSGDIQAPNTPPANSTDKVNKVTEKDHIKGDPNAPIKIVEFSDFDCPFCARFHNVMNEVVKDNDDVAWVYRQFPLQSLHPTAPLVALASECAADLGGNDAFWQFADKYIAFRSTNDKGVSDEELIKRAIAETKVDKTDFEACLKSDRLKADVQEDIDNAIATGGRGTPWSIVISPNGKTYPINGALPKEAVEQIINLARKDK